ncbi:N-glycosylase/DNA lyase [Thermotoga sp. KOL6]|uniref:N-glycosylase/DNA lyase n=1 Tax=Thermotoga sp. KOL6 TaxID=126741 RepID=UPI000C7917F6|nr:N-glycosylase/DNA lyase [Thermotoga sp. KOL6]PLV60460.1 DNA lyase [Thermotoga sp. KOL6]
MQSLLTELEKIREEARLLVEKRFEEFKKLGESGTEEDLFCELSFCVLTANWSAEGGIKAQGKIGKGFVYMSQEELEKALREVGHRYPQKRAEFIVRNRWLIGRLRDLIKGDPFLSREFLVKSAKGIGWKEASHFLRNTGVEDLAILDKHVLRLMKNHGLIHEIPKGWSKKRYLYAEDILRKVAREFGEPLGKLDLYLWYLVKKKVDK